MKDNKLILYSKDYRCSKKLLQDNFDYLYSTLYDYLSEDRERVSKTRLSRAIECFLTNVNNLLHSDMDGVKVSLDKATYSQKLVYDGREVDRKVSYVYTRDMLRALDDLGYIKLKVFEKIPYSEYLLNEDDKFSYFLITDKLRELLVKDKPTQTKNNVELRDKDKNPVTYSRSEDVKSKITMMRGYNAMLSKSDVKLEGKKLFLQAKKIFSESFDQGGRCYMSGGLIQNLPSLLRKNVMISGEFVVELDYKAQHPRIVANLENVYLPDDFDPYGLDRSEYCSENVTQEDFRLFCKKAVMVMLNTQSRRQAIKTLILDLNEDAQKPREMQEYPSIKMNVIFEDIVDALYEHNDYAEDWFYTESWKELQNHDSNIADYIINSFVQIDEIVIPVHDSFIVKEDNETLLAQAMFDAWEYVLGNPQNCLVEKK